MAAPAIRRILATTDFGESSDEVLRQGVALAVQTGAELHILHVEDVPATPRDDAAPTTCSVLRGAPCPVFVVRATA